MDQQALLKRIDQAADQKWEVLDLSGMQITELPPEIGKLVELKRLILGKWDKDSSQWVGVGLEALPPELGQLSNLIELTVSGNRLAEIPLCVTHLSKLEVLHFAQNQIAEIPESIGNLVDLKELYLWGNQLTLLPACIGQLVNLTELSLWQNNIGQIPECITQLTKLTLLNLAKNNIRQFLQALEKLEQLTILRLEDNPLSIPPETIRQGWGVGYRDPGNPKAIFSYYCATRDPNQTQIFYEAKLLLVGEGGSGKTSLANKILDADYHLKPETENTSTEGIDIFNWEFTGHDGNLYKVHIWDFGGQEIYHQTHQFFLTERACYLLVADSRKEDTDHYFWLQSVRLLSDNSPILLIQNEKHNRTCNLSFKQLRGEFDNLRETYRTNLADNNRGLSEIKNAVQAEIERLIPNGIPFPNKWLAVRYALENDGRNYIDYTDYQATCRECGITSPEEMCNLSRFLHELGICLHFQRDGILRHRLILKPNWGTTAVYKILDNTTVKENLGRFGDTDLDEIWSSSSYADMRHELLQLMKEFKVCYEIPRRPGEYIAPHLLSPESPNYDWQREQNLILRYRYKGFMPKGILTRFIVEMHQDIENVSVPEKALVWKTGVIITNGAARAEIIEHYPQREITIRVSGNRPRDLLTIINRKFEEIHDAFDDGLNYDTLIPCNCEVCQSSQKPFTFPLTRLHQCIDQKRPTIECHESCSRSKFARNVSKK